MHKFDLVALFLISAAMAVSALTARAPAVFPASTTAFAPLPLNRVFYALISTITYATRPVKATNFGWLLAASPVRTSDPFIIQDPNQCPTDGAGVYHTIIKALPENGSDGLTSKAAMKYGKRVADFLATHINAVDEEGNYDFTKAKYNFNPSILNRGGCSYNLFGTGSTEPHGAVGTPSDVILQKKAMQVRYYNVDMTRDNSDFTLKALEVMLPEGDGRLTLTICRCEVDGREAGRDFCEDLKETLEKRLEFLECVMQENPTKSSVSYCKEKLYPAVSSLVV